MLWALPRMQTFLYIGIGGADRGGDDPPSLKLRRESGRSLLRAVPLKRGDQRRVSGMTLA